MGTLIKITFAVMILLAAVAACVTIGAVVTTLWGIGIGLPVAILMSIALGSVAGRAIALLFLN